MSTPSDKKTTRIVKRCLAKEVVLDHLNELLLVLFRLQNDSDLGGVRGMARESRESLIFMFSKWRDDIRLRDKS